MLILMFNAKCMLLQNALLLLLKFEKSLIFGSFLLFAFIILPIQCRRLDPCLQTFVLSPSAIKIIKIAQFHCNRLKVNADRESLVYFIVPLFAIFPLHFSWLVTALIHFLQIFKLYYSSM